MKNNENKMNINWFPGHMMKTLRLMEKEIKNVDVVIVLLDARIPYSSQNPEIERIIKNKPRVYVLNKADLADMNITNQWINHFKENGMGAIAINSKTGKSAKNVISQVEKELKLLKKECDRELTQEEHAAFCRHVDHTLYSEVNAEMMQAILDMFNQCA